MSYLIIFEIQAKAELDEAVLYYNSQLPHLGIRFMTELDDLLESICSFPTMFQRVHSKSTIRKAIMKTFPFIIFYAIDHRTIKILSVFHCSRNPNAWVKFI
jgi:toxin ParE1/3/4